MKSISIYIYIILMIAMTSSCMKKDPKWELSTPTEGVVEEFNMGDSFQNVVFFDCETGNYIFKNIHDWDIAVSCSPPFGINLNTGNNLAAFCTKDTLFNKRYYKPALNKLAFDLPHGNFDSTSLSDCWDKNSQSINKYIYIIRYVKDTSGPQDRFIVFQALEKTGTYFKFRWRYLEADPSTSVEVKMNFDKDYNFVHYNFHKDKTLFFEPPKESWDFKLTRYTDFLMNLGQPYPYLVRGVIANRHKVFCAVDSNYQYSEIGFSLAQSFIYTDQLDAIGYDWKYYDFALSRYTVRPNRNYIIRNHKNDYYKLKFVDYYNKQGKAGVPKFVFKKIN